MFVKFTDEETFIAFETTYSTLTGLWYGQEKLRYPAPCVALFHYSIQHETCKHEYISDKQSSLYYFIIFYIGYTILFNIKLVNMRVFDSLHFVISVTSFHSILNL